MIYTLSWLPSITLLGIALMFLIVPVFAVAAVLAAVLIALAILVGLAIAMTWASIVAVRAARQHWLQLGRASKPALEAQSQPVAQPVSLVRPQLHQVR